MFLIVIVTLVISILGLFMQVVSLQTSQLNAKQNALVQTMMTWHNAAVRQTTSGAAFDALPCQLTSSAAINSLPNCLRGGVPVMAASILPPGYNTTDYSFISAAFKSTSPVGLFVLTYVHDTDSANNLVLPQSGGTSIGYSLSDLSTQLNRALPQNMAQGSVTSTGVFTALFTKYGTTGTLPYTIPATIPTGAVGIISSGQ